MTGGPRIAIDAMGGDSGPHATIAGIVRAHRRDPSLEFIVYGDEREVRAELERHRSLRTQVTLVHSAEAGEHTLAVEQCDVRPDLLCLGKGLTGGYLAMAATVASRRVFDAFLGADLSERTLYHGHSFSGNALAAAVALRHLELFDEWKVLDNVRERAAQLAARLATDVEPLMSVKDIRQRGLMTGIELDPPEDGLRWGRQVSAACVRRGVLIRPLGDVIVLMPPLTITATEIDRIVDTVRAAIDEVTSA